MRKRPILAGVIATTLATSALSLAAVAPSSAASSSWLPAYLKGPAPSVVKIGVAGGFDPSHLATFVAFGAGYFAAIGKRFHTTIEWDNYGGGSTSEPAFIGGTDQFSTVGLASYAGPQLAGTDQVGIFDDGLGIGIVFTGAEKYKGVKMSLAQYGAGTKWCEVSPTGASGGSVNYELAANGLTASQVGLVSLGGVAGILPGIQSGECDVVAGGASQDASGIIGGISYTVYNGDDPTSSIPAVGEWITASSLTTSNAFIHQYPKLVQAMVDAQVKAIQLVASERKDATRLYSHLPTAYQQAFPVGTFTQQMQLEGNAYSPHFVSGEWPVQAITDNAYVALEGTKTIPVGSAVDPAKDFTNKFVIQAYKDLNLPAPTGPASGPAKLPTTLGKPSIQAAKAYAALTGLPVPANDGNAPLLGVKA